MLKPGQRCVSWPDSDAGALSVCQTEASDKRSASQDRCWCSAGLACWCDKSQASKVKAA